MIAFLGMGLLGSSFVRALRGRGERVQVWNRTLDRAKALEATGAVALADPATAVQGASRIHLTLRDDATVDEVLDRARPGLDAGAVVIDHTTTSAFGARARVKRWAERGVPFLHAPVFMGPQNALEATGVMLASGDASLFDSLSVELAKMTGKLVYVGAEPERAAAFKLMGNLFLFAMVAGVGDALALGQALGVAPEQGQKLFEWFNPGATIVPRVKRLLEADFMHPTFELAMARKDARLMTEAAEQGGMRLAVLPGIAQQMDRWMDMGHASDDWTVIVKDALVAR